MLALISAIIGFAGPFLPEVLKLFTRKMDQRHELAMLQMRIEQGEKEHLWRLEEINATADIEEAKAIRQPQQSFGIQLLDAAKNYGMGRWFLLPGFYAFIFVDFFCALVRPAITYAAFFFYGAYKYGQFRLMQSVSDESFSWYEGVVKLWGDQDWATLTLVLSYWFGTRAAKAAFGGSARNGRAGA